MKLRFAIPAILALAATSAFAATTATASMSVSTSVSNSCSVSAGPMVFPTYTGVADVQTSAQVTVACNTTNLPAQASVAIGSGANGIRQMSGSTSTSKLEYHLYSDQSGTELASSPNTINLANGTGTIYGKIIAVENLTPAADSYTDSVTITVAY